MKGIVDLSLKDRRGICAETLAFVGHFASSLFWDIPPEGAYGLSMC